MANRKSVATALAGAAIASAMVVSGASAMPISGGGPADEGNTELRSPDAVDAARAAGDPERVPPPPSSIAASAADEYKDLRSPATRDLAEDYAPPAETQAVVDAPSEPSGFDLVSAAIGAAAAAGLSLVLLATLGMRRPTGRRAASAA